MEAADRAVLAAFKELNVAENSYLCPHCRESSSYSKRDHHYQ